MEDLLGRSVAAEERARQAEAEVAARRNPTVWQTADPREHIGKRARIITIVGNAVMFAEVETKHGYCVFLEPGDPDSRRFVAEDEEWPGWYWAVAPSREG